MGEEGSLVEVRLLALPIEVLRQSREHNDGLMREFALIRLGNPDTAGVPHRLHELAEELSQRFGGFTTGAETELAAAEARDDEEVDLVYRVPADAAAAARQYGALLDEADAYCRSGEHLLTLVTPPDALALRRWLLGEFVAQIAGKAPTPWPEYKARARRGKAPGPAAKRCINPEPV